MLSRFSSHTTRIKWSIFSQHLVKRTSSSQTSKPDCNQQKVVVVLRFHESAAKEKDRLKVKKKKKKSQCTKMEKAQQRKVCLLLTIAAGPRFSSSTGPLRVQMRTCREEEGLTLGGGSRWPGYSWTGSASDWLVTDSVTVPTVPLHIQEQFSCAILKKPQAQLSSQRPLSSVLCPLFSCPRAA